MARSSDSTAYLLSRFAHFSGRRGLTAGLVLALGLLVECGQAGTCVLVNLHPGSAGAYLTATGPDNVRVQSAVATYGEAGYFDCAEGASTVKVYENATDAQLVPGEQAAELSCQATNLFALVPAAAGADQCALQWYGNGSAVQPNKQRFFLANLGYDGPVTASFKPGGVGAWIEVAEIAGYGQHTEVDYPLPASDTSGWLGALDATDTLIASTGTISFSPEGNSEVGQLVVLIGSAGSEQLRYFSGCDAAGSNCNVCTSSESTGLRPYQYAFVSIFGSVVLLCFVYVVVYCCCHREPRLFPQPVVSPKPGPEEKMTPALEIELNPALPGMQGDLGIGLAPAVDDNGDTVGTKALCAVSLHQPEDDVCKLDTVGIEMLSLIDPDLKQMLEETPYAAQPDITAALNLGLGSLFVPIAYGGRGLTTTQLFGLGHVISNPTLRFVLSYCNIFAGGILTNNCSGPYFEEMLRDLAQNNHVCSICLTEYSPGSELLEVASKVSTTHGTKLVTAD